MNSKKTNRETHNGELFFIYTYLAWIPSDKCLFYTVFAFLFVFALYLKKNDLTLTDAQMQ